MGRIMDSLTQAALGATLGGAVLGRQLGRSALIGGASLGTLPDLDVLIDYGSAVANFTQHRGFSHSLLVLVPLAFVLAVALQRWRPDVSLARWAMFTMVILVTHPLLDAFTTYGTQLLWPVAGPVALHSIFIIDPLYTVPLLVAVVLAFCRPPARRALHIGLLLSSLYLGWSLLGQYLVTSRVMPALKQEGLENAPRLVQPMPFNTFFWRVTVLGEEARLEIATSVLGTGKPRVERFPRNHDLALEAGELEEGQRLVWFTRGFLAYEVRAGVLTATDVRLGLPGVHPFTFALARRTGPGWQPVPSYSLPRPELSVAELKPILLRIMGYSPAREE